MKFTLKIRGEIEEIKGEVIKLNTWSEYELYTLVHQGLVLPQPKNFLERIEYLGKGDIDVENFAEFYGVPVYRVISVQGYEKFLWVVTSEFKENYDVIVKRFKNSSIALVLPQKLINYYERLNEQ